MNLKLTTLLALASLAVAQNAGSFVRRASGYQRVACFNKSFDGEQLHEMCDAAGGRTCSFSISCIVKDDSFDQFSNACETNGGRPRSLQKYQSLEEAEQYPC
ncbi:hypothetical protein BJX61DRAFT_495520 [Aspergillus egyptiacus]|nr:hypothetical protein BJX61DRAFT_495520 [Aspergillus egyptiacus]